MKTYVIKEIFDSLQGEGARAGTRAIFVRFAGCNQWSGRAEDRNIGPGACARWCDTNFQGGDRLTADALLARMDDAWPRGVPRWCVVTGGEPLLQLDAALVDALRDDGWKVAVETNGSIAPPQPVLARLNWVTVSPKHGSLFALRDGNELKVVLPGAVPGEPGWTDDELLALEARGTFYYRYVQPQDPVDPETVEGSYLHRKMPMSSAQVQWEANVARCIAFVRAHAGWRLSLQSHKFVGLR